MLEPDRLLWSFRKTAGLPTPGVPYIASWEDPGCELRGHFVGHYLSALSLAYAGTGNEAFRTRLDLMVTELGKVQAAMGLGGYLSAFPTELFDRVEAQKPVWAPYYTIHKILAGLVDAHELGGSAAALPMAVAAVGYHWRRTQAVIASKGRAYWNGVLNCEFGGMNELLYRLYRLTRDPNHLEFARLFDKPYFREPMTAGSDTLQGLHANTHMAQVAGFAEAYDVTGDEAARTATTNFFNIITNHHSFATGGSNDHEFWQAPDEMASSVLAQKDAVETQETCTQYNILKIARSLFRWTGDVAYADFYERALLNGILGTARLGPEDWPERALPHRHGDDAHHHHHHHHSHLRRELVATAGGAASATVTLSASSGQQQQQEGGAGGAVAAVDPHRRQHNEQWLNWWAFAQPRPEWNASDAYGPGVFLYLTPLGTGQSKSDNIHHWGFPFHSFWCCYGTVIESYAKLADSIYFVDMDPRDPPSTSASASAAGGTAPKLPPRLYVNQLVSSRAEWAEMGLQLTMNADMFAPGPAATADIRIGALPGASAPAPPAAWTLMLRVPAWALQRGAAGGGGGIVVEVNGLAWGGCPGAPSPGSYCRVTRQWSAGDSLSLSLPMRWWLKPLPERRPQYGGLAAVMMGPYVMVGASHGDRRLVLPEAGPEAGAEGALGAGAAGGADVASRVYPPEEADELLSLQAAWNASLHVRHDSHLLHLSGLEDGGDSLDATFRLGRGCHHGGDTAAAASAAAAAAAAGAGGVAGQHGELSRLHGGAQEGGRGLAEAGGSSHGGVAGAFAALHSLMRLGQHDGGQQLSLEAMGYPNHYLAYDHADVIVLQPGAPGGSSDPLAAAAACSAALWMMRAGLDGGAGSVSFEAVGRPGWYVTAAAEAGLEAAAEAKAACMDAPLGADCAGSHPNSTTGPCASDAYASRVLCRQTCGRCKAAASALRLRQRPAPSSPAPAAAAFAAASSFRLAPPARRAYPAGSHVLAASNRHYLLAPLGNLVDERYTAYFQVATEKRKAAAV